MFELEALIISVPSGEEFRLPKVQAWDRDELAPALAALFRDEWATQPPGVG